MFGGLAKHNSFTRSRHLSESNLRNVKPETLTRPSKSPPQPPQNASTVTTKTLTNSRNGSMFSLPPTINSPLTTFL